MENQDLLLEEAMALEIAERNPASTLDNLLVNAQEEQQAKGSDGTNVVPNASQDEIVSSSTINVPYARQEAPVLQQAGDEVPFIREGADFPDINIVGHYKKPVVAAIKPESMETIAPVQPVNVQEEVAPLEQLQANQNRQMLAADSVAGQLDQLSTDLKIAAVDRNAKETARTIDETNRQMEELKQKIQSDIDKAREDSNKLINAVERPKAKASDFAFAAFLSGLAAGLRGQQSNYVQQITGYLESQNKQYLQEIKSLADRGDAKAKAIAANGERAKKEVLFKQEQTLKRLKGFLDTNIEKSKDPLQKSKALRARMAVQKAENATVMQINQLAVKENIKQRDYQVRNVGTLAPGSVVKNNQVKSKVDRETSLPIDRNQSMLTNLTKEQTTQLKKEINVTKDVLGQINKFIKVIDSGSALPLTKQKAIWKTASFILTGALANKDAPIINLGVLQESDIKRISEAIPATPTLLFSKQGKVQLLYLKQYVENKIKDRVKSATGTFDQRLIK